MIFDWIKQQNFTPDSTVFEIGSHFGIDTEKIYDLGYWAQGEGYVREYADLHINLDNEGLLSYLADGKFVSFVIAPDNNLAWENDIRIDRANLTAKANPIPEPASLSLLGLGLLGLAGLRKKKIT